MSRSLVQHYAQPADVRDALRLLVEHGAAARVVGGGVDLALRPPTGMTTLIDLSRLPLGYIEQRDGGFAIGAITTLGEMLRHPLLGDFAHGVLAVALEQLGSPALRNAATIGGHLARARLSDLVPVLLVLDAELRFFDGADQAMSLADFYDGQWHDRMIVVTEVVLPAAARHLATGFIRFSRTAFDYAILNCAVAIDVDDGHVTRARVAVGETPALAHRVAEVEEQLVGRVLDDETIEDAARLARQVVATDHDQRASAAYRSQLVHTGVRRCLRAAAGRPEVAP